MIDPIAEPKCERCRDTGWRTKDENGEQLRDEHGYRVARECVCRRRDLTKTEIARALVEAGMTSTQQLEALQPWHTNQQPDPLFEWARAGLGSPWCWVLWGPPGRGKTKAACMATGAYLRIHHRGAIFRRSTGLIRDVMSDRRADCPRFEERVERCRFLVIDDVGTERDDYLDFLGELLAIRESAQRMTVLTTNGDPADESLPLFPSERVLSRLKRAQLIEFGGKDMRELVEQPVSLDDYRNRGRA